MTTDSSQQRFNSYQLDNFENEEIQTDDAAGDSKRRVKNELLADEIGRLLFGDSTNLLDDMFSHPLSTDYFNVYLSLPIFGQRVFYYHLTHQFDFDPPLLSMRQTREEINEAAKEWLINYRLNNYIHTDIYIESLLGLLLTKTDDAIESFSFVGSKEAVIEEQSYIFSTVTDVRQFHQFLQSTSGINYWNFFIDSIRLLRSRRSSRPNRIDSSYLNFIYKYYSQQHKFPSITIDLHTPLLPDSSTSDTIWFQTAINAMHQLRVYWLPRYLQQVSVPSRLKIKHSTIEPKPNQLNDVIQSSSENTLAASSDHRFNTESVLEEPRLIKYTLGNISYLDYNPQQYLLIQPSEERDFQHDTGDLNEIDTNQVEKDDNIKFEDTSPSSVNRSIADYSTDANIELFYRILISDSLAGSPFFDYISQTSPTTDAVPYHTCIRFITDAEILLSIPSGTLRERILRQFISRYLEVTATEKLPDEIFDSIEEQRTDLMEELSTNDKNQCLLCEILLKITKFLIPHFLNYIRFDRLRFLLQGKDSNLSLMIDDLRYRLPSINFETFLLDRQNTRESDSKQPNFNETDFISRSNLINCGEQQNDLLQSSIKNQYNTTEKLINTDEHCEFPPGDRFPPLTDSELEQELRRFCTKFEWKDVKSVLGKSFHVPITLPHINNTTFIGDPLSHQKINSPLISDEEIKSNSIEIFTLNIMNSARELFEIDRFISNIMDESLHLFQTNSSFNSSNSDLKSSPLSPVFEEILLTDSSLTTSPKLITQNTNNNAFDSPDFQVNASEKDDRIPIEIKFLSTIGSYFINAPSLTKTTQKFPSQSILSSKSIDNHLPNSKLPLKSSVINTKKDHFSPQSIKFAQKDASTDVKTTLINHSISHFQNNSQQQLLKFIENHINNHQWPLQEYIGIKGQRAWRALKLAADISNLDHGLIWNYHNDLDWISTNDHFGSFGERTYFIVRDFNRRIEQQKRVIIRNQF